MVTRIWLKPEDGWQTTQVALENLKSSSDLDARTASQFTPLHWAATLGHLQVRAPPCLRRVPLAVGLRSRVSGGASASTVDAQRSLSASDIMPMVKSPVR
jgi:hypothetical protein